jgi:hypothetical protein
MQLLKAAYHLKYLADKADVREPIRASVTFRTDIDKARFIAEVMREMDPSLRHSQPCCPTCGYSRSRYDELHLAGIQFRFV